MSAQGIDLLAPDRLMMEAHFDGRCWGLCHSYCCKILAAEPQNATALYYRGLSSLRLNNVQEGFADLDQALSLDSRHPLSTLTHQNKAEYHRAFWRWAEAAAEYALAYSVRCDPQYSFEWGRCLLELNQPEAALQALQTAVDAGYSHPEMDLCLGECHYRAKRWAQARLNFDKAIEIQTNPKRRGMSLARRGKCYLEENNLDQAIGDLDTAIELLLAAKMVAAEGGSKDCITLPATDLSFAYFTRARCRLRQANLRQSLEGLHQALPDLKWAIHFDPRNTAAFASLGKYYLNMKAWDEALQTLNEAIRLDPHAAMFKGWRGEVNLRKEEWPAAIADLSESIRASPDETGAYPMRAFAYLSQQRWEEALADYRQALAAGVDLDQISHYRCALCFTMVGRVHDALTHVEACMNKGQEMPVFAHALMLRGRLFFNLDRYDESAADMAESIRLQEDFGNGLPPPDYYAYYGQTLVRAKRFKEAIASLSKAIAGDPTLVDAYLCRGYCLRCFRKHRQAALKDFDTAIRLEPEYAAPYVSRARCYLLLGDCHKAIDDCQRAIELDSNFAAAYNHRAAAFMKQEDYWSALADFNTLLALPAARLRSSNLATIREGRAQCYEHLEQHENARADRREAKQIRRLRKQQRRNRLEGDA